MREFITIQDSNCLVRRKCKKRSYNRRNESFVRVFPRVTLQRSLFLRFIDTKRSNISNSNITRVTRFRVVPVSSNYSELMTNPWKKRQTGTNDSRVSSFLLRFVQFPPRFVDATEKEFKDHLFTQHVDNDNSKQNIL